MIKLNNRELVALKDISRHARSLTSARMRYPRNWTPKTNEKLKSYGLVDYVGNSVVITDAGLDYLRGE